MPKALTNRINHYFKPFNIIIQLLATPKTIYNIHIVSVYIAANILTSVVNDKEINIRVVNEKT